VKLLERYNLSDTSEDIKGIAFERFLGRTFRGEIGQFFTPRTIVEFMIRMVEPREGDIICDPASGSGGFLIRFFEIVREQILADADAQYQTFKARLENEAYSDARKAEALRLKFAQLRATLDQGKPESRLWTLANRCIYGTDANDRMARTSKMNMIMHGDGHGGVHHHDGFLNVNGIFEERFDLILTNPPFGANVEPSDVVHESDVLIRREAEKRYKDEYGKTYEEAIERVRAAIGKPIASLFELPRGFRSKIKTELLFIERCLALLKPGGRLGIVLPEGIFNNPSLAYVREFCENRAFVRAVVSLPAETFLSSGASVKASLLFMQKFTAEEKAEFDRNEIEARNELEMKYAHEIAEKTKQLTTKIANAKQAKNRALVQDLAREARAYNNNMAERIKSESRDLLKRRFRYQIFLYEAARVGISPTGVADENELFPNDKQPQSIERTCLELYHEFRSNPDRFSLI
jgi:type I restriction enzyme M protein